MAQFIRCLPLWLFYPFRWAVTHLRRGSLPRSAAVLVLRQALRANRGRLSRRLDAIVPLDMPGTSFDPIDSMVMDAVYWWGVRGYEGKVADLWIEACRTARSVLEVGGNVGLFTVIGARAGSAAYTVVEPVPSIAAALRRNLARNGIERVKVLNAAAIPADAEAPVSLSIPNEGREAPVGAFLAATSEVSDRDTTNRITVQGLPFRDLIAGCDVIKIDAEGIEADLLGAVEAELIAARPLMVIEVLPESVRLGQLIARLAVAGRYEIVVIPEWGSDVPVVIEPSDFTSAVPATHHSKDVMLRPVQGVSGSD